MFVLKQANNLTLIDMLMIGEFSYLSMERDFLCMKIKQSLDVSLGSDPYTDI